jgi:hypothetical protein
MTKVDFLFFTEPKRLKDGDSEITFFPHSIYELSERPADRDKESIQPRASKRTIPYDGIGIASIA